MVFESGDKASSVACHVNIQRLPFAVVGDSHFKRHIRRQPSSRGARYGMDIRRQIKPSFGTVCAILIALPAYAQCPKRLA